MMPVQVNVSKKAEAAVAKLHKQQLASIVFVVPFSNRNETVTATNINQALAVEIVRQWLQEQDAKAHAEQRIVRLN